MNKNRQPNVRMKKLWGGYDVQVDGVSVGGVYRALTYGELAAMMPRAGGQYVYLRESLGPLWGFLYGWTLFLVIQTGTIAAAGLDDGRAGGDAEWPKQVKSSGIRVQPLPALLAGKQWHTTNRIRKIHERENYERTNHVLGREVQPEGGSLPI